MHKDLYRPDLSRREFNVLSAGALTAGLLGSDTARSEPPGKSNTRRGLNILFVFTDQERYTAKWPAWYIRIWRQMT